MKASVEVPLAHPRDRTAPLLRRLKDEILAELIKAPAPDHLVDETELEAPPQLGSSRQWRRWAGCW